LSEESCVPQSAQNRAVSVFSERHFGHLTATTDSFNQAWLKIIKESRKRQFALKPSIFTHPHFAPPLSLAQDVLISLPQIDIQPPAPLFPRRLAQDV
jgi:hypothetical protein